MIISITILVVSAFNYILLNKQFYTLQRYHIVVINYASHSLGNSHATLV